MKKFEKLTEPEELDFYSIELDHNGKKQVHVSGYVYGDTDDEYWRYVEVCFFIEPLEEFIKHVAEDSDYVFKMMGEHKNYIDDLTEKEVVETINNYFGHPADYYLHYSEITIDTPCGDYVC